MADIPWTEKYRPRSLKEIRGQNKALQEIRKWMEDLKAGKKIKALLLVGPPGSGKTSAAYAIAYDLGYEPVEINASDMRDREHLEKILQNLKAPSLLTMKPRLIILDEVDAIPRQEGSALASLVKKIVSSGEAPVIMTANDAYERHMYEIRNMSIMVKFYRLRQATVMAVLRDICRKEGIRVPDSVLALIAKNSQGDLRAAINDLEALAKGTSDLTKMLGKSFAKRDVEKDVFDVLTSVFYGTNCTLTRIDAMNSDVDPDLLLRWVEENVPYAYSGKELAQAYEYLSLADLVKSRIIRTNNWGLFVYYIELMTVGVCASKSVKPKGVRFKFPELMKTLSQTKVERAAAKEVLKRMAEKLHLSTKVVRQEVLPLILIDAKREKKLTKKLAEELRMDPDELVDLLESLVGVEQLSKFLR